MITLINVFVVEPANQQRLDSRAARTAANGRCEAILACSTTIVFDVRLALVIFRFSFCMG
jgi:hypothetical protein